jgi:hypothetical protein
MLCGRADKSDTIGSRNCSGTEAAGVSPTERWYEPARANFLAATLRRDTAISLLPKADHDFVTQVF